MNERRVSALLDAGIPLGVDSVLSSEANPFIQSIAGLPDDEFSSPASAAHSVATLKAAWMKAQLEGCEDEFMAEEAISILVGTWNVDGTVQPGAIEEWLANQRGVVPDVVFVGLQEVDTSTQAYIYEGLKREEFWSQTLLLALHAAYPGARHERLVSKLYVGIYGAVFVRDDLRPLISHVATSFAACGLMGIVGNKGAVGIRFRLHSSYVCFVSSHLAAHVPALQRRNQDAAEIARRTLFNCSTPGLAPVDAVGGSGVIDALVREHRSKPGPAGLWDASVLVWAGDLNYRVPLDPSLLRDLVAAGLYEDLLAHDQLVTERAKGRVLWTEFEEGPIRFAPTFKYDRGTSVFDTSEKNRAPAWCDRVLYRRGQATECVEYASAGDIVASDHKPVRAVLRARVRRIVRAAFERVYERLLKQLDQLENELIPATQLQAHQIDAGRLVFRRLAKGSVEILNVGQVLCQFRLVPPTPDTSALCQPWIRVRPVRGILAPGESRELVFYFYLDAATLGRAADGSRLEDIAVIHVDGGRDHFVHVTGTFRPTPFCRPLAEVSLEADVPDPVTGGSRRIRKVPQSVWLLVDFIVRHGIETESLFLASGGREELDAIQDALDEGRELPSALATEIGVLSAGEMLLRFLDCLPVSVIPYYYYKPALAAAEDREEASSRVLQNLPEEHLRLFEYLMVFLGQHLLPRNPSVELMDMASVFAPVLLRASSNPLVQMTGEELHRAALFLALFLR